MPSAVLSVPGIGSPIGRGSANLLPLTIGNSTTWRTVALVPDWSLVTADPELLHVNDPTLSMCASLGASLSTVTLKCTSVGVPTATVRWLHVTTVFGPTTA